MRSAALNWYYYIALVKTDKWILKMGTNGYLTETKPNKRSGNIYSTSTDL